MGGKKNKKTDTHHTIMDKMIELRIALRVPLELPLVMCLPFKLPLELAKNVSILEFPRCFLSDLGKRMMITDPMQKVGTQIDGAA